MCVTLVLKLYTAYSSDPLSVPRFTSYTATSTRVDYQVERSDTATIRVITGYEVSLFGVPIIGEYNNAGKKGTVPISPAVPGAQYRITAWTLGNGSRRSATPAVKSVTTGDASEFNDTLLSHCMLHGGTSECILLITECFESALHY